MVVKVIYSWMKAGGRQVLALVVALIVTEEE
jgi:hypothetical protein